MRNEAFDRLTKKEKARQLLEGADPRIILEQGTGNRFKKTKTKINRMLVDKFNFKPKVVANVLKNGKVQRTIRLGVQDKKSPKQILLDLTKPNIDVMPNRWRRDIRSEIT